MNFAFFKIGGKFNLFTMFFLPIFEEGRDFVKFLVLGVFIVERAEERVFFFLTVPDFLIEFLGEIPSNCFIGLFGVFDLSLFLSFLRLKDGYGTNFATPPPPEDCLETTDSFLL
jgi:hypothetical protein